MNSEELLALFLEWFSDSYPSIKPAKHSVMSHVAFAEYVIAKLSEK
jgi:hypothetical protein